MHVHNLRPGHLLLFYYYYTKLSTLAFLKEKKNLLKELPTLITQVTFSIAK